MINPQQACLYRSWLSWGRLMLDAFGQLGQLQGQELCYGGKQNIPLHFHCNMTRAIVSHVSSA